MSTSPACQRCGNEIPLDRVAHARACRTEARYCAETCYKAAANKRRCERAKSDKATK
jgi:hypothetical protein